MMIILETLKTFYAIGKTNKMTIPFYSLQYTNGILQQEFIDAFKTVLQSNSLILGDNVAAFEVEFSKFTMNNYSIGVSSGLDALKIALKSLGVNAGDEVIVPSNTYIATWIAVSLLGAKPVPVEPDEDTFNISAEKIKAKITDKTKVILPVHMYGNPCNMNEIMNIAQKYHLYVVEDFAQAQGASYNGKPVGGWGNVNATSFYPSKNLGALGDAGAITTSSVNLYKKCLLLRNYGSSEKYYNELIGYNNRLDELQAALLNVKLNYLKQWNEERRKLAHNYKNQLKGLPEVELQNVKPESYHVYHLFVIETPHREELKKYLDEKGVQTMIHYPVPPHLQKAYSQLGFKVGDFPIAEKLANNLLSLPLYNGMTEHEQMYVCQQVRNFFKSNK